MKYLKFIIFYSLAIAVSCGTDHADEPDFIGNGDENNPPNYEEESPVDYTGNYVLWKVNEHTRFSSGVQTSITIFSQPKYEYNNWLNYTVLTGTQRSQDDGSPMVYTYNLPNSATLHYSSLSSDYELNNRLIIEYETTGSGSTCQYYDSKNRLVREEHLYKSDLTYYYYTYDNSYNITGIAREKGTDRIATLDIEYTDIPAKTIPLQNFCSSALITDGCFRVDWPLMEAGLYGNCIPLKLIKRIKSATSWGDETEFEYEYTLNKAGYVEEMIEYQYMSSGTSITTLTFEWKKLDNHSYTNWLFSDIGSPYYRDLQKLQNNGSSRNN